MSWSKKAKVVLAALIYRSRRLNRWAHMSLPRKRMSSGVMLYDAEGRLLLVKPSYRPYWLVPGGMVEHDEPPWLGARRETFEEVGLDLGPLRLVGVDWRSSDEDYDESLHFMFDGGCLSADQRAGIACDGIEIVDYRFVAKDEAERLLEPDLARRVMTCWQDGLDRPAITNRGAPDEGVV